MATGPAPAPVNADHVAKVAGHFGSEGELLRWPSRTNHQELCAWVFWSRMPADVVWTEREISTWLNDQHDFGDAALLRRTMVEMNLVTRTQNGREYRRVRQDPPSELALLLERIAGKTA
jgi:hypothetical protein